MSILYEALQKAGIPYPPTQVVSGKYTRWGRNKEFYAIQFSDGSGYYFGNFKDEDSGHAVFEKNHIANQKLIEEARNKLEQSQNEIHEKISQSCTYFWNKMSEITEHPYLAKKKIKSYGLKIYMDKLVIPLYDINGKIWSFQYIASDGTKHFRSGGRKHGCFYVIGDAKDAQQLFICEGYATGATIYECTKIPTIIAFDAGNLYAVTQAIKEKFPQAEITLCADNDAYGEKNIGIIKAQNVAQYLQTRVVYPTFKDTSTKSTDFNDLFVLEGADAVTAQLLKNNSTDQNNVPGFSITEDALMYFDSTKNTSFKICSPIKIVALTQELEEENAGRLIQFKDRTGIQREVKIFDSWLSKDGSKIHDILYKYGLNIATGQKAKNKLNEFINSVNPKRTIIFTLKSGWHGKQFLTASDVYGKPSEKELLHIPSAEPAKLSISGTLEDWQKNVAAMCVNNSRLILAVSAAFASMILTPCDAENFFLHFFGRSSQGKTTMLDVAASVFGGHDFTRTWRMTDNGLEGIAMAHNDLCLFLDEISECDPSKVGAMAYMLVNGSGKTRATSQGTARKVMRWKLGGVSTGEEQLSDVIKSTGKTPKAGQLLRILSIPALPENGYGLFEDIHNFPTPADFAMHLKNATQQFHGTAFPAFIQAAIEDYDNIKNFYNQELENARCKFLPPNASGQDFRAFKTFATCAIGGILATKYNITAWNNVDIMDSVMTNFSSWLENKKGVGNQEDIQALTQIRLFFEKYGDTRFQILEKTYSSLDHISFERAGYKSIINGAPVFFVFKNYFEEVVAKGLDLKHVKILLRDLEILETDNNEKRFTKVVRIGASVNRFYAVTHKIFEIGDQKND